MPAPVETRKLTRGLGRLIRHTAGGAWSWQYWDRRASKWTTRATGEINLSLAQQWVTQQAAMRLTRASSPRAKTILFRVAAEEYEQARKDGDRCVRLRPSSIRRLKT